MLKHGEVNALNVHGLRRMSWCPPHFTKVSFEPYVAEKTISDWIYENLQGRFFLAYEDVLTGGRSNRLLTAAFEHGGEASFFGLWLPSLNLQNSDF